MPFIADGRTLIRHAFVHGYALPAFNICSLEMAQGCIDAARELSAPILLQTYQADLSFAAPAVMVSMVRAIAEAAAVPVGLHLDHGINQDVVLECLKAGYSSVMLDGSTMNFLDLCASTLELAQLASSYQAGLEVSAERFNKGESAPTDPEEALRLREAGADMIACSVGSEHGQTSRLDLARLEQIAKRVQAPLVLHGGSGINHADVQAAIALGVVKINVGSALYRALLGVWQNSSQHTSHRQVYTQSRAAIAEVAKHYIQLFAAHKGEKYELSQSA
ncbi:MAG: class II fructose-bisphosphate aldolase [Deinococcales bacterium]